jgi:hypothetical protein
MFDKVLKILMTEILQILMQSVLIESEKFFQVMGKTYQIFRGPWKHN